ncbi:UDP-N-acetylmuramate dehydrogenase [Alteromonas australica]|uniref:UDP-N-acetylenolpyruvoylglucosamine reductase n=1 Tax=Alteromonas australica TaxID=589873 RepID=A0A075NYK9_9ALTE|nr:UDP-N-acetylmuramate dehydrogenase [Alteromonas australica]AIF98656.1 hypothetical protein EP13_08155 [Alteromonas australica]
MSTGLPEQLVLELVKRFSNLVNFQVPLNTLSYWKIGGKAECVISPSNLEELQDALSIAHAYPTIPSLVIGDTSNILFDDLGYKGILIKLGNNLSKFECIENKIYCEAGVWVPGLAFRCYKQGLSGIEHTCGIPGRIGGLVYMNGGSQRRGILENVESVIAFTKEGTREEYYLRDMNYSYRKSPFQGKPLIIAAVNLKLHAERPSTIRRSMLNILSSRRKKFPRKLPNCGSVFLSDPKMYDFVGPPGFAIEKSGLKGYRKGNAQISPLHANFIVNLGGASSDDVLYLIALARKKVETDTGFLMDCEVRYVRPNGEVLQAHEYTDRTF